MSEAQPVLDTVTSKIRERLRGKNELDATLKFDLRGDGFIHIDAKVKPPAVSNDDKPADCTVRIKMDDLIGLSKGTLNPMTAFMSGKIKVEGNMAIAMKIGPVLKG